MDIINKVKKLLYKKENILVLLTLSAVVLGIVIGLLVKSKTEMSDRQIYLLSFPGEMLMSALKMLIIPLIVSSLITSLAGMDTRLGGRMGLYVILYYASTTFLALLTGIMLVTIIHPGNPGIKNKSVTTGLHKRTEVNTPDALLDLLRNLIPVNLIEAYFKQATTEYKLIRPVALGNDSRFSEYAYERKVIYRDSTNVLGLVTFSVAFGFILGLMGNKASVMTDFCGVLNEVIMRYIMIVMWYSPIGIFFLIVSRILEIDNLAETASALGWFLLTVVAGLIIHAGVTLNLIFFIITRKNPLIYFKGMLQAWATAIGTDSSSATLPVTFRCLEENNGVSKQVTRFVLPIGAAINMDGTALYEAVAAIFIAQICGYTLSFGQMFAMSIAATLTAIGGSSVPSAGLITMILVLNSVGLPLDDISLVLTLDWIIDRSRTSTNVMGDAFCAGIIDHLCRDERKDSQAASNELNQIELAQ